MKYRVLLLALLLLNGCHSLVIVRGPNRNTNELNIEVDWTTPQPPSAVLIQMIEQQIQAACDPSVKVNLILDEDLHKKAKKKWTSFDVQYFAIIHKNKVENGLYMLWCDGVWKSNPSVGGYSWGKCTFAMFPNSIPNIHSIRSAVSHEVFHNLGLVDKFLGMVVYHKHPYGHHCTTPGCLMSPVNNINNPAYNLCQHCIADLEQGKEKDD